MRPRRAAQARRSRGFGLLEAIVALAVFAATGMAIFSWVNSNIVIAGRLQDSEKSTRLAMLGLEWANTLNPAEQPSGAAELAPGLQVDWRTEPLTPRTSGVPFPGGTQSGFDLAMFRVDLHVSDRDSGVETTIVLRRVGTWRNPSFALPAAP